MQSVKALCKSALYLEKGRLIAQGDVSSVVSKYLLRENVYVGIQQFSDKNKAPGNGVIRVSKVEIRADDRPVTGAIDGQTDLFFMFSFWNLSEAHSPMSRSEEHTSELQSLLRISYAVF